MDSPFTMGSAASSSRDIEKGNLSDETEKDLGIQVRSESKQTVVRNEQLGEKRQDQVLVVSNDSNSDNDNEGDSDGREAAKPLQYLSRNRRIALVVTVTGASFLNTLSMQSIVIILPKITAEIGIPDSGQQWIVSSYSLAFSCFLLIWGSIADIYGKRRIFILGSALVVPVTAFNPLLRNEIAFNLFRGLQGFGAAANVPTAIGILGVVFPPGRAKNYAFSAYASGGPLGSIFGNMLSGIIANYTSWKWVFWVLAILAAFITIAGVLVIPTSIEPSTTRSSRTSILHAVDWIGGTLVTGGLMVLLFALAEGNIAGWSTPWVPALIVVSLLLIAIFVVWQWYQEKYTQRAPLMKVSIFKNQLFSAACVIMTLTFLAVSNFTIYATFLWQDYQGLSPIQTMLRFLPGGVFGIIVAVIVSRLISMVQTHLMLIVGQLALAVCSLLMAIPVPSHTSYFAYAFLAVLLVVIGADTAWPALTLFTSECLPQEDQALGGALINAFGQIGRAIGLAIATAIQTAVMANERGVTVKNAGQVEQWDVASIKGIRAANWFSCAIALSCVFFSFFTFRGTGIVGKS